MRFPSLESLSASIVNTVKRFSLPIISAIVAAGYGMRLAHANFNGEEYHFAFIKVIMCCYIALLLFVAATLFGERRKMKLPEKMVLHLLALIAVVGYYFLLPRELSAITFIRFALIMISLHLLVAFIPFIKKGQLNGFWQYNKILFLRILISALYTGVLYLGLTLALLAVDKLFNIHINDRFYMDLWIVLSVVFNTCFFLAGFPANFDELDTRTDYPKGLKIFTQYVLLPLISIYLLILYAYMFKIIITAQWPVGWVSYLVLGFSIAGILALLLIYPVRNDEQNKWILLYSRLFYFAIIPLVVLLFLAIRLRIVNYGITENRYFVLLLACWLFFIALYFLFSRKKSIKLIPISLCVLAILSSFGPWSAFSISRMSQEHLFKNVLLRNDMLKGDKVVPATKPVSFKDRKRITSIIEYMNDMHGYKSLQPFFTQRLDTLFNENTNRVFSYARTGKLLDIMNIKPAYRYEQEGEEVAEASPLRDIQYKSKEGQPVLTTGYDLVIPSVELFGRAESKCTEFQQQGATYTFCLLSEKQQLSLSSGTADTVSLNLQPLLLSLQTIKEENRDSIMPENLSASASGHSLGFKVIFKQMTVVKSGRTDSLVNFTGTVLISLKGAK